MSRNCDQCGKSARYLVGVQIEIYDLHGKRDRVKQVTISLCEGCEALSREFLRKDAGQKGRLAGALCQEVERDEFGAFFSRASQDSERQAV